MKKIPILSPRLQAVARLTRQDAFVIDVGTDHAYLPIALCLSGRARGALATDVHQGPLACAQKNIAENGLGGVIDTALCDGLRGVEVTEERQDILICGMGGDLIIRILTEGAEKCREGARLILQPMTHVDRVRRYLCESGFAVVEESLAMEDRVYQIIAAEYTGEKTAWTPMEYLFGRRNMERGGETFLTYVRYVKGVYEVRRDGKKSAGADASEEEEMIAQMEVLLHDGQ